MEELFDLIRLMRADIAADAENWKTESSGCFCSEYLSVREDQLRMLQDLENELIQIR